MSGRWTAVSDVDYWDAQRPRGSELVTIPGVAASVPRVVRECGNCHEPFSAAGEDSFVLQPLCDRCLGQSLDRAMADRQKARTK